MDPARLAYFSSGYASAFLPALMGWDTSKNVKASVLYYGVIIPTMGLKLRPDTVLQWVKVGMRTYLTKHYPAMTQAISSYRDQGNPIEVVELPNSSPFFDWKQLDAESAAALEKTLVFLEKSLR